MKERPILFSSPMVRALLAGTKTQTRRAVKPQPTTFLEGKPVNGPLQYTRCEGFPDVTWAEEIKCPYGQPGDRLWVRETFADYNDGYDPETRKAMGLEGDNHWIYRADFLGIGAENAKIYKPSIFMPRAASRLLLEIVAVRVERVQAISEADAVAEGVEVTSKGEYINRYKHYTDGGGGLDAQHSYQSLWASINGPDSWAANPWVWVVEFKVLEGKEASHA